MAEFISAYKKTFQNEGGYSNIGSDKGGETYAGISRRFNPNWDGWDIVDAHKPLSSGELIDNDVLESKVRIFYKRQYWDAIKADLLTSQRIADFTFDWLVTSWDDAIKALQKAVNVTSDGIFGQHTLSAVNEADEDTVMEYMIIARVKYYTELAENDPSQRPNLQGWLNRVHNFA